MKNSREKKDAATSRNTRQEDKKAVNTKVNPVINFQIGLIAALVAVFLIMELTTSSTDIAVRTTMTTHMPPMETNIGPIKPVPNEDPKPIVKKSQPDKTSKVDPNKPPKVIDNQSPDELEPTKKTVKSLLTSTTATDTDAPASKMPTTSTTALVNPGASKEIMSSLHEVPLFPGCSAQMDREERLACLNDKMARFIQRRFDTSLGDTIDNEKLVKIAVMFTIGDDGFPKDILVKAPNEQLEREAYKVIASLPKMTPGKIDNIPVNVTYALPIRFQINN